MSVIKYCMDIVRIFLRLTRPFSFAMLDFIYKLLYGSKFKLPPIEDKILLLPATELAEKIRKKQVSSETVVKAFIKRILEVEPLVNACVDRRYEEALTEARAVDSFLSSTSKTVEEIAKDTPLLGVPFSCKESIGVKGLSQTCGMYFARDRKAEEDSVVAARYRRAGGIPVVVSNVPEFCTWWETANVVFGRTKNPYDNAMGVGGSSGGEAAVLCYAGAVIGIGNDLAGSIRMPSAFNGIYGHKPSPDTISNLGAWPADIKSIDKFVGTGPMCRYAQDLPLLCSILSENKIGYDKKVDFRKTKIYYMESFPGFLLKPTADIRSAVRKAAEHFEDAYNNKPIKISIKELQFALEIWECKLLEAGIPPFKTVIAYPDKEINLTVEFFKKIFGLSHHTLPAIYYAAIERRKTDDGYHKFLAMFDSLKKKLDDILAGGSVLLIPTHPEPPPHYLMTIPKYPNQAYTCIMNVLGYPATQIPAGFSRGLPIGIQAISANNCDHVCISTAVELDKVFGGWTSPSRIET